MAEQRLSVAEAHALVCGALTANRTSIENAVSVASALVGAELVGQGGHGLRRVAAYASQSKVGKVDGFATPQVTRTRPAAVSIDAAHGFAYPALDLATAELAEIAPKQGIAMAGIRRSHHAGVAGLPVEALAGKGLVALFFTNSPPSMAPWGGSRALFGTNPIAFAAPAANGAAIIVDVSLSKVARGKVMAASQKGENIPQGWALDAEGQPTTDAKAALAGTMLPTGDAKGATLALMVELLAAALTGANYAFEQASFFDDKGSPPGTGQFLIAIDPEAFGGVRAVARFTEMAEAIAGTPGARVPGARRQELRARMISEGIPVDAALIDEIAKLGAR
ncbi:MAG TPA: Ldh family oxidoreductase [Rhizobiaceae bacterium]|nr:Ldh family oxidoreductase [Rhizobiaceae bacterium]